MRVTVIELWGRGAMLHYCSQLVNHLAHRPDVEVTVLLPTGSDTSLIDPKVSIDYLDVIMDASLSQKLLAPIKLAKLPLFYRTIRDTRPNLLHLNNCHVWYIFTLPWLRKYYPIVSTLHDVVPHPGIDDTWRKHREIDASVHYSDHIFVHGEALKEQLLAIYPTLSPDQVTVIPLGELSLFTQYPTDVQEFEKVALFFGRIRAYKGLEYFLDAAAIVHQKMPEARFVIAGEGDLRPYQKQIANASNLEVINSYISDDQVAPLINKSSILVLPYTQASQSAVIPVAYAFEKPVVTTSVGCLMDVVEDGLTGLVVPPRDPQALAQAMLTLLGDPEMRRNCGRKGNQKMKDELGWDKIIEQTIQVYESSVVNFKS